MYNFITLFDKNYLSRGLALYDSLVKHCEGFFLYILAMDTETEDYFRKHETSNRKLISLPDIESFYPELAEIKKGRTRGEYCWTLTSYCIQYAIKTFNLESCTYLDSDIFFFGDPAAIFDGMGNNSVIITEHRYTPEYDQTKTSGKYCVQFMFFKNDIYGLAVLEWWRQRCKEWCYARAEDSKFGDQKYLDDWTTRFEKVYVPAHLGCGVAPWNIQQYDVIMIEGSLYVRDKITKKIEPLIFFHFHGLKEICSDRSKSAWSVGNYTIQQEEKKIIYSGYIKFLTKLENENKISTTITNRGLRKRPSYKQAIFMVIKNIIKSFFIIKNYHFFMNKLLEEYNNNKRKIIEIS